MVVMLGMEAIWGEVMVMAHVTFWTTIGLRGQITSGIWGL